MDTHLHRAGGRRQVRSTRSRRRACAWFRVDLHEQRGEQEEVGHERQGNDQRGEPAHAGVEFEAGEADHHEAGHQHKGGRDQGTAPLYGRQRVRRRETRGRARAAPCGTCSGSAPCRRPRCRASWPSPWRARPRLLRPPTPRCRNPSARWNQVRGPGSRVRCRRDLQRDE